MQVAAGLVLFSVLIPSKMWFAANEPILIGRKSNAAVTLVLTDFTGRAIEAKGEAELPPGQEADLRKLWPAVNTTGTYVLFAVPAGKSLPSFVGTPLVVESRVDNRPGAPTEPMVTKVEPLCFAKMSTDKGEMTMVFYYDVAPNTASNFLTLAGQGFYDGLTFHRIVTGFVAQGGDPRGNGTGGPGYQLTAEFNDRKHDEGVLSMARNGDPLERQGERPRPEFANSAGSQFFICLAQTEYLDGRYTAFGKVVRGLETVKALGGMAVADAKTGRPQVATVIKKVEVVGVTAEDNPYLLLMDNLKRKEEPTTQPVR